MKLQYVIIMKLQRVVPQAQQHMYIREVTSLFGMQVSLHEVESKSINLKLVFRQ